METAEIIKQINGNSKEIIIHDLKTGDYAKIGIVLAKQGLQNDDELFEASVDVAKYYKAHRDELLKPEMTPEMKIDLLELAVCGYFGIETKDLKTKTRKREICLVRQIVYYFIMLWKIRGSMSIASLAKMYGQKHSNVIHAHQKVIPNLIETNKEFASQISDVKDEIVKHLGKEPATPAVTSGACK